MFRFGSHSCLDLVGIHVYVTDTGVLNMSH